MTVGVWLLIGIVLIGGAIFIAGAILAGLAAIANSVWSTTKSVWYATRDMLGRKNLDRQAFVPEGLGANENPLPQKDSERDELKSYEPRTDIPLQVLRQAFQPILEPGSESRTTYGIIDVTRNREILDMSDDLPYARLMVIPSQWAYPMPRPAKPKPSAAIPGWASWRHAFGDPSFEPPYWGGALSFLNRFVDEAYEAEVAKVRAAVRRKAELVEKCRSRNQAVYELAEDAERKRQAFEAKREKAFAETLAGWERDAAEWEHLAGEEYKRFEARVDRLSAPGPDGLLARIDLAMRAIEWPPFFSSEGETRFDPESGVLIHEHRFPDPSEIVWIKVVQLKSGPTAKPANKAEMKEAAARLHPALCIRLAAELIRLDTEGIVKGVAINGWADYTEKATGQKKRAYCASMFASREQVLAINLRKLDALSAFFALKGVCARSMELTPIAPAIRLDMKDPRFVDPKEILAKMAEGENLAAMDWEDFEHLIRELFEREFAGSGAEVKVTQASRDQGVDAIVFNPDPIRGGKIVIQAKRYTNTVDVSAVRDLYGAVINEGATKGILVTTSHFGPDAYSFAKGKPLTLLTGNELLGLLEKQGYKFRIDLVEAKSLL